MVRKLGQKVRLEPSEPSALAHTTVYLDDAEHRLLCTLPASALSKTRHVVPLSDDLAIAVDVFHGRLTGLTLAEIDLGPGDTLPEPLPAWLGLEVTHLEDFTGGALADVDEEQLARLLDKLRT